MSEKKVAIVVGATGITGRAITQYLDKQEEWNEIYTISRKNLDFKTTKVKHINVNLQDRKDVENKLGSLHHITHIFYAALVEADTLADYIEPNLKMLSNVVEVIEKNCLSFKHVALVEGANWYALYLGQSANTPAKEDDPRAPLPNFYYDQEDYLRNQQVNKKWNWSAVRPNPVCGYSIDSPNSLMIVLAVYGTICKELNLPFKYPGTSKAYTCLLDACDSELVAKTIVWSATTPACANQAFNISNGDIFRWCQIWPLLASFFDLEMPDPPYQPIDFIGLMSDKAEIWNEITKRYNLQKINFEKIMLSKLSGGIFIQDNDHFMDVNKARRFGFTEMNQDSGKMFVKLLTSFREQRVIP
jgi:nucleoside-diphosphate-sugar epimerase